MTTRQFDLLIIGGGITGCGIALDAVTRGMKTALVEMNDFASGTSSRSTKLIHGGLRYLSQYHIKLVREIAKERQIVYANGPHVTPPIPIILPIYKNGAYGKLTTSLGLKLYDWLGEVHKNERSKMLTRFETLNSEPLLKKEDLIGGASFVEYQTDDGRLTIEILKEAVARGAYAMNYAKVVDLHFRNGKVIGVKEEDPFTKETYDLFGKYVVNAAGPWVEDVLKKDHLTGKRLIHTKGVHLVFDQSTMPISNGVLFENHDGRLIFAIPRNGKTYVGTTDTLYDGDLGKPEVTRKDWEYLIKAIQYQFPSLGVNEDGIESCWAGIRPLIYKKGKNPSEISRKDEIWVSDSGLITIAGGKLTGYRKMAESVVDFVALQMLEREGILLKPCQTKSLPISGGDVGLLYRSRYFIETYRKEAMNIGYTNDQYERLIKRYGSNIKQLFEIGKRYEKEHVFSIPLDLYCELMYGMEKEMVTTPADFFIRRTGALYFNINWVIQWKDAVITFMAQKLKWSKSEKERYKQELEKEIEKVKKPRT